MLTTAQLLIGRGRDRSERTHLVHIVEFEGESWRSNLTFRDALRSDPDLRERYLAVKQNAVAAAPEGRSQYNTAKHGFIEAEKETLKNGSFPQAGYEIMDTSISATDRAALRESVFHAGEAGTRCLLDVPLVQRAAMTLKADLIASGRLTTKAEAIQTIAFDKTDGANWKVAWHQDLMFPFARPVRSPAYTLECVKEGVDYARPPRKVLEKLLAVRLHLDDCDETNGPLRVSPGSHLKGIIPAAEVASHVASQGEVTCLAREGQALLMRPLLLHASSKALAPKHRRVLHVVFHEGGEMEEEWHRRIE